MAQEFYGFFDPSEEDDRQYSADEVAAAFRAMGGTGVGNGLTVSPSGGRIVTVSPGSAMINGYLYNLSDDGGDPLSLTIGASGSANRYDRVVLQLNLSATARNMTLLVREGTPGASPVPPALVQTDVVKEISLCKIMVRASTSTIAAMDIEDERGDTSACGWLTVDALQYDVLDQRYSNTVLADNLTTTVTGRALDARQGKVLNDAVSLKLATANVANNLTTTASGYALDARQGKVINDKLVNDTADTQIHVYTHTYDSAGKIHKFTTSDGKNYINGRAKITKAFSSGDKFQVNGITVTAYNGAYAVDELPVDRWLTFVYVASEKIVNFKTGGSGRNYRVIAVASTSALPSTALENTLAIITATAITQNVWLQPNQPTAKATGDVWIRIGYNSNISFNADRKFTLMVYPIMSYQFNGTSWAVKDLYGYKAGAWVRSSNYVYDHGVMVLSHIEKFSGDASVSFRTADISLYANGQQSAHLTTATALDMTNVKSIEMAGTFPAQHGYTNWLTVSTSKGTIDKSRGVNWQDSTSPKILNVANYSGMYYITFDLYAANASVSISSIKLVY